MRGRGGRGNWRGRGGYVNEENYYGTRRRQDREEEVRKTSDDQKNQEDVSAT